MLNERKSWCGRGSRNGRDCKGCRKLTTTYHWESLFIPYYSFPYSLFLFFLPLLVFGQGSRYILDIRAQGQPWWRGSSLFRCFRSRLLDLSDRWACGWWDGGMPCDPIHITRAGLDVERAINGEWHDGQLQFVCQHEGTTFENAHVTGEGAGPFWKDHQRHAITESGTCLVIGLLNFRGPRLSTNIWWEYWHAIPTKVPFATVVSSSTWNCDIGSRKSKRYRKHPDDCSQKHKTDRAWCFHVLPLWPATTAHGWWAKPTICLDNIPRNVRCREYIRWQQSTQWIWYKQNDWQCDAQLIDAIEIFHRWQNYYRLLFKFMQSENGYFARDIETERDEPADARTDIQRSDDLRNRVHGLHDRRTW